MNLPDSIAAVLRAQRKSGKALAIVLAGHNGSGKSTLWYRKLAPVVRVPLVNADRMMLSILPEPDRDKGLPRWARELRDSDTSWMRAAQKGVEAFVAQAMSQRVPFATETVFSHLRKRPDGSFESKAQLIETMRREGYFTLLVFVGLVSADLSLARVATRVAEGGHAVDEEKIRERFPRTQQAIRFGLDATDASLLVDNSRTARDAFTLCRVEVAQRAVFDIRRKQAVPPPIRAWLDVVRP